MNQKFFEQVIVECLDKTIKNIYIRKKKRGKEGESCFVALVSLGQT